MPGHNFNHFRGKRKKDKSIRRKGKTRKQRLAERRKHINKYTLDTTNNL